MDLVVKIKVRVSDEIKLTKLEDCIADAVEKLRAELGEDYQEMEAPGVSFKTASTIFERG